MRLWWEILDGDGIPGLSPILPMVTTQDEVALAGNNTHLALLGLVGMLEPFRSFRVRSVAALVGFS